MSHQKERLSQQAVHLARSGKSIRLYTTLQVAKRISVRSMTLMRWVANQDINCPAVHLASSNGVHWLWSESEIQAVSEFKKWAFTKRTHRRSRSK